MAGEEVAFVAGATGFTGRAVVAALRDGGIEAIAHVRPDSRRLSHWQQHFSALGASVDSSAWQSDAIEATLRERGPTLIFSLLGTTRKRANDDAAAGRESGYEAVDYGLSAMLLQATERSGLRPRFIYLSSVGVPEHAPLPQSYLRARWQMERDLAEASVPFTVARPSIITGSRDEDRPSERFGANILDGAMSIAGLFGAKKFASRYRSTTSEELARALVRLARDPTAVRRTYYSESLRD